MMQRPTRFPGALCVGTALALLLAACATPPPPPPPPPPKPMTYVVLLPNLDGSVGKVLIKGDKGEQTIDMAGNGAPLDGSEPPAAIPPEQVQRDFGTALAARPVAPDQFLLYFETGGSRLTAESQALIPTILAKALARENADVSVIGHTDTAGRAEANATLAYQRASSIATLLRERGMRPANLTIESHGESNLLVPTPDETPEPRNRRVEITIR